MNPRTFPIVDKAGLVVCAALLVSLTGCVTEGSYRSRGYRSGPVVQVQAGLDFEDDYDYYPGYETYYSRSRHEFVYRDGGNWVRRPEPRGISVDLLLAAPSVRMDFRDAPEHHHAAVVKSYPKRWTPPGPGHDAKPDDKDQKNNRKDDKQGDRKDDDHRN